MHGRLGRLRGHVEPEGGEHGKWRCGIGHHQVWLGEQVHTDVLGGQPLLELRVVVVVGDLWGK